MNIDFIFLAQKKSVEVNWTKIGEIEKIPISKRHIKPDGSCYQHYQLKFSCKTDRKFWALPDISMTDEEETGELNEETGRTFTVPEDFIQYERQELMEMRQIMEEKYPLFLTQPLNLPPLLDCVKAYHRE